MTSILSGGDAELVGQHLGVHGLVPHAEILGADAGRHRTVGGGRDLGIVGRHAAIVLDVETQADAAQPAFSGAALPAVFEAGPVGQLQRPRHVGGELARGQPVAAGRGPGQLGLADQVRPAQLDRIAPGLPRSGVDQALNQVVRLDPADAAIGRQRRGAGEHAADREIATGHPVGAAQGRRQVGGDDPGAAPRQVGAVAPVDGSTQAEEASVGVQCQLAAHDMVARLGVAEEGLAAFGRPFHRPAEPPGGEQGEHELGIDAAAGAEAAAGVGHDHVQAVSLDAEQRSQAHLQAMAALAAGVQGQPAACRIDVGDAGARFHEVDHHPVLTSSSRVTWAALAKASAVAAASPPCHSKETLSGASSHRPGASADRAWSSVITAGSGW